MLKDLFGILCVNQYQNETRLEIAEKKVISGQSKAKFLENFKNQEITSIDLLKVNLEYLKTMEDEESTRKTSIETKLSHILAQSGLMITLSSIVLTFLYDKVINLNIFLIILITLIFIIALYFLGNSIRLIIKTYNLSFYGYVSRAADDIINYEFKSEYEVLKDEAASIIYGDQVNITYNNNKATYLNYASINFRNGIILIGLGVIFMMSISLYNFYSNTNKIANDNKIMEQILSNQNEIIKKISNTSDSVIYYLNLSSIKNDVDNLSKLDTVEQKIK